MKTSEVFLAQLHAGQKEVLAHPARYKVVCCGRRWGKTTLGLDMLVNQALDGKRQGYFAPTWRMSGEVWRDLKRILRPVIRYKHENERRLETITDGVIECWSLDHADSVRGRAYHRVVIDEASVVPDLQTKWTLAISPLLTDYAGDAIFLSTPKGYNYFQQLYLRGLDPAFPAWMSWNFPTASNPHIPAQEVEEQRRSLPDYAFRQEYLAEFIADSGTVFRNVDAVSIAHIAQPYAGTFVMGVDWARSHDFTVLSLLDVERMVQVDIERFNQIRWAVQRDRLQTMYERWRPRVIFAEENSIGSPNIEALQAEGLPVVPFQSTGQSKAPLIDGLALAIEREQITLLDDPIQKSELKAYQMERTSGGNWRYQAPAGGHDDTIIALALAWHGRDLANSVVQWRWNQQEMT